MNNDVQQQPSESGTKEVHMFELCSMLCRRMDFRGVSKLSLDDFLQDGSLRSAAV